jgi:hypothetical protein
MDAAKGKDESVRDDKDEDEATIVSPKNKKYSTRCCIRTIFDNPR